MRKNSWKITYGALFLVLLFVLTRSPAEAAVTVGTNPTIRIASGLIGYWSFDGVKMTPTSAIDSSGQNRTGSLAGGIQKVPGKSGQALKFDGTTGNISLGNIYDFSGRTPFTTTVWVNMPTGGGGTVIGKFNGGVSGQWIFSVTAGGAIGIHREVSPFDISAGVVSANTWHMTSVTFDGTTCRFYIDGSLINTNGTLGGSVASNSVTVLIGARFTAGVASNFFKGTMDELRVYNRALSTDEILTLYKNGAATVTTGSRALASGSGLAAYWPMDASDISTNGTVFDRNGQGGTTNNGTISGGVTKVTSQFGQALQFDGSTGLVDVSTSPLNLAPTDAAFSVAGWFKTGITPSAFGRIATLKSNSSPFHIMYSTNSARNFSIGGSSWGAIWKVPLPSANTWHHFAITYNGAGATTASNFTFFVDNVPQNLTSASTIGDVTNATIIGSYSGAAANEHFNGAVDELRIYKRVLLPKEIHDLYNQPRAQALNTNDTNKITGGLVLNQTFNGADIAGTAALDRSGSNNNGVLTNGPTVVAGKVGQALKFNGSNSFVNNPLSLSTANSYSVSAWINPSDVSGTFRQVIDTRASNQNTPIRLAINNGALICRIETPGNGFNVTLKATISANQWAHAVCTFSGTTLTGYLNGVLIGTATISGSTSSTVLNIGQDPTFAGENFAGTIDEVRIYNRALNKAEVNSLYQLGL